MVNSMVVALYRTIFRHISYGVGDDLIINLSFDW